MFRRHSPPAAPPAPTQCNFDGGPLDGKTLFVRRYLDGNLPTNVPAVMFGGPDDEWYWLSRTSETPTYRHTIVHGKATPQPEPEGGTKGTLTAEERALLRPLPGHDVEFASGCRCTVDVWADEPVTMTVDQGHVTVTHVACGHRIAVDDDLFSQDIPVRLEYVEEGPTQYEGAQGWFELRPTDS